jgi:hypothetical protein
MSLNAWALAYVLKVMCGPGVTPECACYSFNDLDQDGDVDLADFAELQTMDYRCDLVEENGKKICVFVEEAN